MHVIDLESHHAIKETYALKEKAIKGYSDNARLQTGPGADISVLLDLDNLEQRIAAMDEAGIDACVLSHQAGIEAAKPDAAVELARIANDTLYEATKKYPGRIYGWAALPMRDPVAAAKELARCITELGFYGWNVYSNFGIKERLDDPVFAPVLKKADELGCVTYIHPSAPNMDEYQGMGSTLWGGLGYAADTCLTFVRLMQTGALDRYPNIKFMLGHFGEGFPFVLKRMSGRQPDGDKKYNIDHYFKNNVWITTSGNTEPATFRCSFDVLGAERILVGSDYPMGSFTETMDFLNDRPLSIADRKRIYSGNAQALAGDRLSLL